MGRWSYPDLVRFALAARDSLIRLRATAEVCRLATDRGDAGTLRKLARARSAATRIRALVALAELAGEPEPTPDGPAQDGPTQDGDAVVALSDPSPLIRAYARSRTTGSADFYRRAVASAPTPATVAGLSETGGYADAPLLFPLLTSDDPKIRASTVRALAALDVLEVGPVLPLLRDPSPAVVRAAALALAGRPLPGGLAWQLLADARPEVRRAGYRLLTRHGAAK